MKTFALTLAAAFSIASASQAAVLLTFNTAGNAGTETSEPSTFNAPNVLPSTITLGAGITPAANGNRLGGSNFFDTGNASPTTLASAVADNEYFEFTVTPAVASTYAFNNFAFIFDRSSTGPNAVTLRSSLDAYTLDLATATGLVSTTTAFTTLDLTANPLFAVLAVPVTFRLYAYGATAASGTGGFDTVTGATTPNVVVNFPEPTTLAALSLGGLMLRRRK